MTKEQLNQLLADIKNEYGEELEEFWYAGIRFEEKEREINEEITDFSKHNINREDEREFPEFGTDEYEEMDELDGVSAWNLADFKFDDDQNRYATHCYLIASDDVTVDIDGDLELDENEQVMKNAVVIAKLF